MVDAVRGLFGGAKMKHNHTERDVVRMAGHLLKHHATRGSLAKNDAGQPVLWLDPSATRWCLLGALRVCARELGGSQSAYYRLWLPLPAFGGKSPTLVAEWWDVVSCAKRRQLVRDMQQWDGVSQLRLR